MKFLYDIFLRVPWCYPSCAFVVKKITTKDHKVRTKEHKGLSSYVVNNLI
jgi:hypothetical protein